MSAYLLTLVYLLLPVYLIRFHIGPLPSTALEVLIGITFLVWLKEKKDFSFFQKIIKKNKLLVYSLTLFLFGATLSVFFAADIKSALGAWKAFYVEPILIFFILIQVFSNKDTSQLRHALIASGLLTTLLAIYQHFTGFLVPYDFWQNNETYRVTAWYGFPNAVGLFLAPIWPLALYSLKTEKKRSYAYYMSLLYVLLSPLAIFFAKSTGALIALFVGIVILLLFHARTKKPTIAFLIIGIIFLFSLPSLSSIKDEVLLTDRSGSIRISMWHETISLLKDHPIKGAGMHSYSSAITPYHTRVNGEGIEIFHHPHNIFFTIWVNTGLVGLIGFIGILLWFYKTAYRLHDTYSLFLLCSMTILLVHGLVDSPVIKNDLALVFWLFPGLLLLHKTKKTI